MFQSLVNKQFDLNNPILVEETNCLFFTSCIIRATLKITVVI